MPAFILKRCIDCFVKPLTHIINRSFIEGIFPKELKQPELYLYTSSGFHFINPIMDLSLF